MASTNSTPDSTMMLVLLPNTWPLVQTYVVFMWSQLPSRRRQHQKEKPHDYNAFRNDGRNEPAFIHELYPLPARAPGRRAATSGGDPSWGMTYRGRHKILGRRNWHSPLLNPKQAPPPPRAQRPRRCCPVIASIGPRRAGALPADNHSQGTDGGQEPMRAGELTPHEPPRSRRPSSPPERRPRRCLRGMTGTTSRREPYRSRSPSSMNLQNLCGVVGVSLRLLECHRWSGLSVVGEDDREVAPLPPCAEDACQQVSQPDDALHADKLIAQGQTLLNLERAFYCQVAFDHRGRGRGVSKIGRA